MTNADAIGSTWVDVYNNARGVLSNFFEDSLGKWSGFADSILDIVGGLGDSIGGVFGGIFDGISGLLGGNSSGGGGGLLSIAGDLFGDIFGGNTSSQGPVDPSSLSGIFSPTGLIGGLGERITSIFGGDGFIGGLFSEGGFFGSGGVLSNIGSFAPQIAAVTAAIFGLREIIGGLSGARSPQELCEDQLREVDQATREGRNEQVQLGQTAGVGISFLGGFDENSTFFGIDRAQEDLQRIGDVLVERFGFNQALALRDGVIRLEDFTRDFSENNERIVAEVQAATAEVELSLTDIERNTLSSIGGALVEVDRLFDSTQDSAESTADRLANAYAQAFDTTIEAGREWVRSTGIDADRIATLFNATSAEVTEALFGVTRNGMQAFEDLGAIGADQAAFIADSFMTNINGLNGILNTVDLGTATGNIVIPQTPAVNTAPANNPNVTPIAPAQQQAASSEDVNRLSRSVEALVPLVELSAAATIS